LSAYLLPRERRSSASTSYACIQILFSAFTAPSIAGYPSRITAPGLILSRFRRGFGCLVRGAARQVPHDNLGCIANDAARVTDAEGLHQGCRNRAPKVCKAPGERPSKGSRRTS